MCVGETNTETLTCSDGTTTDNVVSGTRPWQAPAGTTCIGSWPGVSCSSDSVCDGTTEAQQQTCSNNIAGATPAQRPITVTGTDPSCPPAPVCPPFTVSAGDICAGETYTETTANCDDNSVNSQTLVGTRPWDPINGVSCPPYPGTQCTSDSVCVGQTTRPHQTCSEPATGRGPFSRELQLTGTGTTGSCSNCPGWTTAPAAVCAGLAVTETRDCNGVTETRTITGTMVWNEPDGGSICSGQTGTENRSCLDTQLHEEPVTNVAGTLNCACDPATISWSPYRSSVCAGRSFTQTGTCPGYPSQTRSSTGVKSTTVTWTGPQGYYYTATLAPPANLICSGITLNASASCSDSYGTTAGALPVPATITGTKGATSYHWQSRYNSVEWNSKPPAAQVCAGVVFDRVGICSDTIGRVNVVVPTSSTPVTGTRAPSTVSWSCDDGSSPSSYTAATVCQGVTCWATATCSDTWGTTNRPATAPANITGTNTTGTCASGCTPHTWTGPGGATRGSAPSASTVCVGDFWTGVNDCGVSLGTVNGTKTTGTCTGACTPATESWTASGQGNLTSRPTESTVCTGITYTGVDNCGTALGTVAGTKPARHLWSISDSSESDTTTIPVAANYCTNVTWSDTPTCAGRLPDISGTQTTGTCCVVDSNTQRWTAPGQTTLTSKPTASAVCSGVTYTGNDNCVSLGTVVGTKSANLTWTRRSDGLVRGYADGVIVAADVCRGDGWDVVAVCQSTPSAVNGAKDTNRAAWACAGNGSSYTLPMGWYFLGTNHPDARYICRGITCKATSWECHQPSSYFSHADLTQPADVVGTKTTGVCEPSCVVDSSSEEWTASGQTTLTSKPAASAVCSGVTYTGENNCDSLGTVAGSKAASHLWSSSGTHGDRTTTPVAANYCPAVTWTDSPTCTTKSADIVGTKTGVDCGGDPIDDYRWSFGVQWGPALVFNCPDAETDVHIFNLLGTEALGACYSPGDVNNYQILDLAWNCPANTPENLGPYDVPGEAVVWMTQTCVPVQ